MSNSIISLQCNKCSKKYSQENSLKLHLKQKHKIINKPKKLQIFKLKSAEQSFLQIQKQILMFIGQLSQKYTNSQPQLINSNMYDSSNNAPGKNHFTTNFIAKNPFECQNLEEQTKQNINYLKDLNKIEKNTVKQIVINDLQSFNKVLQQEYVKWYFADPYEDQMDFSQQFTLDNIPKLIKNYYKKNLKLKSLQITIFLLWIQKFLKKDMFTDFWRIVCLIEELFVGQKDEFKRGQSLQKKGDKMLNFLQIQEILLQKYEQVEVMITKKQMKRLIQLYVKWIEMIKNLIQVTKVKR